MQCEKISDTYHILTFKDGTKLHLVGTAHVSKNSAEEVALIIEKESPDRVCIELDQSRFKNKTEEKNWENTDIRKVFKEGKGFFLLANTALASFQKRMGAATGANPGAEILGAAKLAEEKGIPISLCDREIQTTFKRAWSKSGLWNKCKLLATLISAAFSKEEISEKELEELKNEETLESMLKEVAKELPKAKEVLIDERDRFLATKIYTSPGKCKVAVIGAGHTQGIIKTLEKLESGELGTDVSEIDTVPPKKKSSKVLSYLVPALIILLLVLSFALKGWDQGLKTFLLWLIVNTSSTFIFTLISGAHILNVLACALTAPFFAINPVLGVGMLGGILEATLRKPKVSDFENVNDDAGSLKGWYKNRILHCLLVFLMSSVGSSLGSLVAFPILLARL